MTIRKFDHDDMAAVLTLMRRHAEIDNYADIFAVDALTLSRRGARQMSPNFEIIVSETADGKVVGYALFFILEFSFRGRPLLYLNDLMVDEAHRRRGVARQLLDRLGQEAKARNCFRIKWGVSSSNITAIAFYERMGAHREIDRFYYTLDEASFPKIDCAVLAKPMPDG